MSKNRYINTKIWSDPWFYEKLNPLDRYLFIYLLTNDRTNIAGVYEISIKRIAFETGIESQEVARMLKSLEPKIFYNDSWVVIPNMIKNQNYKNIKVAKGITTSLQEAPNSLLCFIEFPEDFTCEELKVPTNSCKNCKINDLQPKNRNNRGQNISTIAHDESSHSDSDLDSDLDFDSNSDLIKLKPTNPEALRLAELLYKNVCKQVERELPKTKIKSWAKPIDEINRLDNRSWEQIEMIIKWTAEDNFWKRQILSGGNLRKKFDQLFAASKADYQKRVERVNVV